MSINANDVAATTVQLPPLLTCKEAAVHLRVSTRTIRRWAKSGRLNIGRTTAGRGGKLLIPRTEIARLLRETC